MIFIKTQRFGIVLILFSLISTNKVKTSQNTLYIYYWSLVTAELEKEGLLPSPHTWIPIKLEV